MLQAFRCLARMTDMLQADHAVINPALRSALKLPMGSPTWHNADSIHRLASAAPQVCTVPHSAAVPRPECRTSGSISAPLHSILCNDMRPHHMLGIDT
jgi:hypothetical protein